MHLTVCTYHTQRTPTRVPVHSVTGARVDSCVTPPHSQSACSFPCLPCAERLRRSQPTELALLVLVGAVTGSFAFLFERLLRFPCPLGAWKPRLLHSRYLPLGRGETPRPEPGSVAADLLDAGAGVPLYPARSQVSLSSHARVHADCVHTRPHAVWPSRREAGPAHGRASAASTRCRP